jgi:hypothetical protein
MSVTRRKVSPRSEGWWQRVYTKTWNDGRFAQLGTTGKLLYFLVTTGPHTNPCGLFPFSPGDAADRLRVDVATIVSELNSLCTTFEWKFDPASRVLWISRWWEDHPTPDNESIARGWVKTLAGLPDTPLLEEALDVLLAAWTASGRAWASQAAVLKVVDDHYERHTVSSTVSSTVSNTGPGTVNGTAGYTV